MKHSELLTKLMDDVIHRSSKMIKKSDLHSLSKEETKDFIEFLNKQSIETTKMKAKE